MIITGKGGGGGGEQRAKPLAFPYPPYPSLPYLELLMKNKGNYNRFRHMENDDKYKN